MKITLIFLIIIISIALLTSCSSSSDNIIMPKTAYPFTYDEFITAYNEYFDIEYSIDATHVFHGFIIESHFIDKRNLFIEITRSDSYTTRITVSFTSEVTDASYRLLHDIFKVIDADYDKSAFDEVLEDMIGEPSYNNILNCSSVYLHFTSIEGYAPDIKYSIDYYPLKTE